MAKSDKRVSPMSMAVEWVGRIMAAALMMVLPGLLGQWLDQRYGTSFLALIGFGIGMVAGIGCLLLMTKSIQKKKQS